MHPADRSLSDPDQLLSTDQAAALLGVSARYLEARRVRGGGPPYVRLSSRAIRYRRSDLLNWSAGLTLTSTSVGEGGTREDRVRDPVTPGQRVPQR